MKTALKFIGLFLLIAVPISLCFLVAFYFISSHEVGTVKIIELAIRISLLYVAGVFGLIASIKKIRSFPQNETEYKYIFQHAFLSQKAERIKFQFYLILYRIGLLDYAIKGLSKLLTRCERYHDTSAALFFLAKCYQKNNMPGKAINCYETLLKTDIANSSAWTNLGLLYESKGKTEEATHALEQAISHDSGNITSYCKLANLHYQYNRYEQANYYSLRAYQLDTKSKESIIIAALSFAGLGDEENAKKFCEVYGMLDDNRHLIARVETHLRVWNKLNPSV